MKTKNEIRETHFLFHATHMNMYHYKKQSLLVSRYSHEHVSLQETESNLTAPNVSLSDLLDNAEETYL